MIEKKSGDDDVRVVSNVAGYELGDFRSGDFVPVNPVVSIKNPGKGAAITGADLHPSGKRLLLVTAHKGTFEHALGIPFEPASLSKHANLIAGPQDHFYQYVEENRENACTHARTHSRTHASLLCIR